MTTYQGVVGPDAVKENRDFTLKSRIVVVITFQCKKCNAAYRVSDKFAGKKVRCSKCKEINIISTPKTGTNLDIEDAENDYLDTFQQLLKWEQQAPPAEVEGHI